MTTADQRDAEQAREWNTYTAKVPIDFYGTRAYNTGDRVPASAVDGDGAWIAREWVEAVSDGTTANAGSQTAPPPGPPPIDPALSAAAPPASSPAPPPADTAPADTPPADTAQEQ